MLVLINLSWHIQAGCWRTIPPGNSNTTSCAHVLCW